jgi:hypothetical protein
MILNRELGVIRKSRPQKSKDKNECSLERNDVVNLAEHQLAKIEDTTIDWLTAFKIGLAIVLPISIASCSDKEIATCDDPSVTKTILQGSVEKFKTAGLEKLASFYKPGAPVSPIMSTLPLWSAVLVNIRQQSYDRENKVRYCLADFKHKDMPALHSDAFLGLLMNVDSKITNSICLGPVRYKIEPLLDKKDQFFVSWRCLS